MVLLRNIMYFTKSLVSCVHGGRGLCRDKDAHGREVEQTWVLCPPQHPCLFIFASEQIKAYVKHGCCFMCRG